MRKKDRKCFPVRSDSSQTDKSIGLSQLWRLRCSRDRPNIGYAYSTIGADDHVDDHVDAWVDFGVDEGLLSHEYRDKLDRYMQMNRGEANNWLMQKLANFERDQLGRRFQW